MPEPEPAPERIGRYDVVSHLATGGMGQVFLARSAGLGGFVRHVVIKTLDLPGTDEDEAIAMFLDEARLLGLLHHQHITPVYEVGRDDDGMLFLVMDYVHGTTAHDVWQRTNVLGAALPIDFSLTVAAAAASGLHYAHTRRDAGGRSLDIVHRDVSLSNLMIGFDGAVKLIDFGIAKAANRSTQTQAGFIKGKLGYMAPEQLRGLGVDARTDVFALGIVLYELTTMRRAFRDESDQVTMDRIRNGTFAPPRSVNPDYPPELERIVTRALRAEPRDRYPNAEAMRRDLDLLGHQLGLVLGDAAVVEVMSQLFEHRDEPWQGPRPERPPTQLDASELRLRPPAPEDDSRMTEPQHTLRAATAAHEALLDTPPHGLPKRPSAFSIDRGSRQTLPNITEGVTIVPGDPEAAAIAAAATAEAKVRAPSVAHPDLEAASRAMRASRAARQPPARLPTPAWSLSRARRRRRTAIWIVALLLAAGAGAAAVYFILGPGGAAEPSAGAAGRSGAVTPAPPSPPPPPQPAPAPPPGASGSAAPTPAAAAALPPGASLQLTVKSTPPDATVLLDGKRLGRTPYTGQIEAAPGTHSLRLRKKGYAPVSLDIELTGDLSRDVTLQRAKSEAGSPSSSSSSSTPPPPVPPAP
ncbi:MAG TPA: serine/threonine-protein kinase [Kofleriaceae bacterium]|nr:serine/threonine-protein kinase [Kofleriaceae bacterium]